MTPANPFPPTDTILIVDDDTCISSVLNSYLSAKGYRVLVAASGKEALALRQLQPGRVDLLITDMQMPDMNGMELVGHLLATEPDLRVIYMSGYADEPPQEALAQVPALFLCKPFTVQELLKHVLALLA